MPNAPLRTATDRERGRLARLLVVALGLLGFMVVPAAPPAAPAPASGVRVGAAQSGPGGNARARTSRPRGDRTEITVAAVARHLTAATTGFGQAVLPSETVPQRRDSVVETRTDRPASLHAVPRATARSRAPPALHRI